VASDALGKAAQCPACGAILTVAPLSQPKVPAPATSSPTARDTSGNPFALQPPSALSPFASTISGQGAPSPENPYQSPATPVAPAAAWFGIEGFELASRGVRLLARVADYVILMAASLPGFVGFGLAGAFDNDRPANDPQAIAAMVVILGPPSVVSIVQWFLISTSGQSIGKKLTRIRIVHIGTHEPVGFLHGVFLREWVLGFIQAPSACCICFVPIPIIVSLIDVCWIFGEERRCLHDLVAKTHVVVATPLSSPSDN